jgi:hypothetical protein
MPESSRAYGLESGSPLRYARNDDTFSIIKTTLPSFRRTPESSILTTRIARAFPPLQTATTVELNQGP